jgi:hypothetical protein
MIEERWKTPEKGHTPMVLGLTIFFSLLIGLFLRFA